jgi:hypothetical protein
MRLRTIAVLFAALPLLAACDYFGGEEVASEDGVAEGAILEGSVSDAMIPTDDLTSQSPALKVQPGEGGAEGGDSADSAAEGEADGVEVAATEAPAAAPEAAATE